MAKYYPTHSCGHTGFVELFGKETTRTPVIEAMERRLCDTCRAEAAPDLTGTPKQIAWAADIRSGKINAVAGADLGIGDDEQVKLVKWLNRQTSASWWIDRRGELPQALYNQLLAVRKAKAIRDAAEAGTVQVAS